MLKENNHLDLLMQSNMFDLYCLHFIPLASGSLQDRCSVVLSAYSMLCKLVLHSLEFGINKYI